MILERLFASVDAYPDKVAVQDERLTLTYAQLKQVSGYFARLLTDRGASERVGIILPASAAFAPVFYGCRWAKRVAIPLNFLLQPGELKAVVDSADMDTILTVRFFENAVEPLGKNVIFIDDELAALKAKREKWGWLPGFVLKLLAPSPPPVPTFDKDELAVILYTSGTSGLPKGVMLTEGNLATNIDEAIGFAKLSPQNWFLSVVPTFHGIGLTAMTLAPLSVGGSGYYIARFNASAVVKAIEDKQVAVFAAVASMFNALLRLKKIDGDELRSLQLTLSGGEALPLSVYKKFRDKFGVELLQGYGLTETSPIVSFNLPEDNRPATVGQPLPSWELKVIPQTPEGDDEPREADLDEPGELWLRGPSLFAGYFRNDAANEAAFVDAGDGGAKWFRTGDYASIDADGFLSIRGRKKELIISGGENIFPGEIEDALIAHPSVDSAAVLGKPDETRGEVPIAFVSLRDGEDVSPEALREHCRGLVAGYKVPREVHIESELPKGPTGKVLKRELRDRIEG